MFLWLFSFFLSLFALFEDRMSVVSVCFWQSGGSLADYTGCRRWKWLSPAERTNCSQDLINGIWETYPRRLKSKFVARVFPVTAVSWRYCPRALSNKARLMMLLLLFLLPGYKSVLLTLQPVHNIFFLLIMIISYLHDYSKILKNKKN